ncbi:hypothetical protein FQR65_LT17749 [Abscondita terminalis]|nr:hypothetical protein FQR65_LT17749 [Abscondita terminalis]
MLPEHLVPHRKLPYGELLPFLEIPTIMVIDGIVQEDVINVSFEDLASGNASTLLSSAVAGLNSADVESIEILKDASATSIYWFPCNERWLLYVTTKNGGRKSKMRINSSKTTMRMVLAYSQYNILKLSGNNGNFTGMQSKGFVFTIVNQAGQVVDGDYKILPELKYNLTCFARYVVSKTIHNMYEGSNVIKAYNADETTIVRDANIFLYQDPNDPTAPKIKVLPNGGIRRSLDNNLSSYVVRNSLNYNKTFGTAHELDVLCRHRVRSNWTRFPKLHRFGLQYDRGMVHLRIPRYWRKFINEAIHIMA